MEETFASSLRKRASAHTRQLRANFISATIKEVRLRCTTRADEGFFACTVQSTPIPEAILPSRIPAVQRTEILENIIDTLHVELGVCDFVSLKIVPSGISNWTNTETLGLHCKW
jgi:hypothetical protein